MEGYAEQGARTDSTDQIGFGGARRNRKKRRGLTVFQLKVIGAVTLGFVLIFTLMRQHENSMMFTAGLFGAVMMIMPGIGVAFVHYYNGELCYKRQWTKWAFYAAYPVILIFCAIGATLA